jgi:hypothetical protein
METGDWNVVPLGVQERTLLWGVRSIQTLSYWCVLG